MRSKPDPGTAVGRAARRRPDLFEAERTVFFSDAVVAIAITLLALELPVPSGSTDHEFWRDVQVHREAYLAFGISFAVIWRHWDAHHRLYQRIDQVTGRLTSINMMWLLAIVITPFATRVLTAGGAFASRFTTYATVQALAAGSFLLMLYVANRSGLLRDSMTPARIRDALYGSGAVLFAFVISIPVAILVGGWAYWCWVAIPLIQRAFSRLDRLRLVRHDRTR